MHFLSLWQTDGGLCKKKKQNNPRWDGRVYAVSPYMQDVLWSFSTLRIRWCYSHSCEADCPPLWFNAGCLMSSPDKTHLVGIAAQNVPPHSFTRERETLVRATSRWHEQERKKRALTFTQTMHGMYKVKKIIFKVEYRWQMSVFLLIAAL